MPSLATLLTPWLAALCYYDVRYRRLPNVLTLGGAGVALAWRLGRAGVPGLVDGALGGVFCALLLLLPFILKAAGGGDVKMLFAVGCATGQRYAVGVLLCVSLAGMALGIAMFLAGLVDRRRLLHALRCAFDWRYDRAAGKAALPPRSHEKSRVPFGVAIAVGTLAALLVTADA
ncbi:MAG: A24 family peptidase [Kiritimatiellaeota bacterium]|nr:A24 family peptidase [Kiritimatiellota bacterium]